MDSVHWGTIAARARLATQMQELSCTPDDSFAAGFAQLVAGLERQFRDEERAMEAANQRALHSHREQHARVLATLHQVGPRVEDGDSALGREALMLLGQWLESHYAALDVALLMGRSPMGQRGKRRTASREPITRWRQKGPAPGGPTVTA